MILSVIIPTYNRSQLLTYTLGSLNKQLHPGVDYEVIVVDDGSADDTCSMVAGHYSWVKLLKNPSKGAPSARNTGLANARGKYVMYLDSDDLVGPGYFAQKIAYLEAHPETGGCYGEYDFFKADGEFTPSSVIFKHKYPLITTVGAGRQHLLHYLSGNFLPPHTLIWRRDLLVSIKGHDTALSINQDVDLFIRAIFNGAQIAAVADGTKVYIRSHSLDERVGDARNQEARWLQILELRKRIYSQLAKYGYDGPDTRAAMSKYLFDHWKLLRHKHSAVAAAFLSLAKEVHWPVQVNGNIIYRTLSAMLGPVNAANVKYFLLKRD